MTSFKRKYKARKPEQTVRLIQNFFLNKGYTYEITKNICAESKTWSCHIVLRKEGFIFLESNGKGMTEQYSLASGFAELYERFCNLCPRGQNIYYNKCREIKQYKEYGYLYSKDEKKITYEELLEYPAIKDYISSYSDDVEVQKNIMKIVVNGNPVGVPYTSLDNSKTIYVDPRIIQTVNGSQGMASGNSVEEAIIQANCELWEKFVGRAFFINDFEKYHFIDLSLYLTDSALKEKIDSILKCGYKFYILDLSYNFNLPVLMSVLISPKNGQMFMNFGSFPVLEIALERVITELYQGIETYELNTHYMVPFRTDDRDMIISSYSATNPENIFPESIFEKARYGDYNKEIFVNKKQSFTSLLDYCDHINKLNNYEVFWTNRSMDDNISAVHLFCPTLQASTYIQRFIQKNFSNADYNLVFYLAEVYNKIFIDLINNTYDFEKFKELTRIRAEHITEFDCAHTIFFVDPFKLSMNNCMINNLFLITQSEVTHNQKIGLFERDYNNKEVIKYLLLNTYAYNKNYTKEEILKIFNEVFDFSIKEEEIELSLTSPFLVKKILFEPFRKFMEATYPL